MKILITGIAGFVGTHTAEYFTNKGDEVVGIDNLSEFELSRTEYNVKKSREHNLKFLKSLGVAFHKQDCRHLIQTPSDTDLIIHCAAQPAMTISIEQPFMDFQNNVEATVNMLEIARKKNIPFINCSSIHVYGNKSNSEIKELPTRFDGFSTDENAPLLNGEITPLHVSKRATELYTQAYIETYGLRATSFRLTGMYGERQFGGMDHGWVANFAIRTIFKKPIYIFGTDKQVRDIIHPIDVANAFDLWYIKGKSEIYNIGGGQETMISIKECLELLSKITGRKQKIIMKPKRLGDLHFFVSNYQKAFKDFDWMPKICPETGLNMLVKWINENRGLFG